VGGVRARLCIVVSLLLVGGGGGDSAGDGPSASPAATENVRADQVDAAVLESYVSAMAAGDIDAAMELRCEASRISPSQREAFERQLRLLIEEEGELGLGQVEVEDSDPRVVSSLRDRHAVLLRYWLMFDGAEVSEPLLAIVADEDGQRRLCSHRPAVFPEMYDELREGVADLGAPTAATLAELMPESAGPDPRLVRDEAIDTSTPTGQLEGATEGWIRMWAHADGGATVAAYRYASPADARRSAGALLARRDTGAIETFDIPDIPGARGVRLLSLGWLWIQPPTVGPYIDEVTMVFGDTVVIAGINSTSTESHHQLAIAQARDIVRLATASG
jgi:hypothetical protein